MGLVWKEITMSEKLKEAEERARNWLEHLEQWQQTSSAELKKLKKEGPRRRRRVLERLKDLRIQRNFLKNDWDEDWEAVKRNLNRCDPKKCNPLHAELIQGLHDDVKEDLLNFTQHIIMAHPNTYPYNNSSCEAVS